MRADPPDSGDELVEGAAHRRHQQLTFIGQQQAPVQPPEQPHPERFFEGPDLVADGGLRDVQLVGRAREAEMASRRFERAQCREWRQAIGHGIRPT